MRPRLMAKPCRVGLVVLGALFLTPQAAHAVLPPPQVPEPRAIEIARGDANAREALRETPDLYPSASRNESTGDWEVGFFTQSDQVVQVVVDDASGQIEESWTGYQVAWRMARGYPGAFGRALNAPWVWLPLCAIFVLGLLDWRRPLRLAHLDLLVVVAGFGLSHYFFNRGEIGLSVPLAYPPLLYLLGRALWLGFRGGQGLRPTAPIIALAVAALFLVGVRVGLNVADSNVIDVGLSGVIGADRIGDGDALYGEFPSDSSSGDTYGPVAYYAYVPFEQLLPWSGRWDELPAAHAAAIFFDLGTLAGLFLLGRRLRPGRAGRDLGIVLCFAWAACPYTAFALESNTNDALVSMLLVGTLLVLTSPPLRGVLLGLAAVTKFAPLALAPLFATYDAARRAGGNNQAGPRAPQTPVAATSRRSMASGWRPLGGPTPEDIPIPRGVAGTAVTGPARRVVRVVGPFAVALLLTVAVVMTQTLLDPGLSTFWERTIGNQAGRDSPFSVWGQEPSLEWLRNAIRVATVALVLLVALRPRRRDAVTVAALGAAVLIALQLSVDHWFYLYLPWFLPFLFIALLARDGGDGNRTAGAEPSSPRPGASATA
jgi:hypothetical protein